MLRRTPLGRDRGPPLTIGRSNSGRRRGWSEAGNDVQTHPLPFDELTLRIFSSPRRTCESPFPSNGSPPSLANRPGARGLWYGGHSCSANGCLLIWLIASPYAAYLRWRVLPFSRLSSRGHSKTISGRRVSWARTCNGTIEIGSTVDPCQPRQRALAG